MSHLTLEGDNVTYNPIGLAGDSSLAVSLVDTGTLGFGVEFLGLRGYNIRRYRQYRGWGREY
jgi:hypothetical protein